MARQVRALRRLSLIAATMVVAFGIVTLALGSSPANASVMTTLYASPSGSGSGCTLATPCSLAQAQSTVRTLNSAMTGDIAVALRGGIYQMSSTWTLTSVDSGNNGHNVIYQAYGTEKPTISGGQVITGWTEEAGGNHIWDATVPPGFETQNLYVNGLRANNTVVPISAFGTLTKTSTGYTFTNPAVSSWSNITDVTFVYSAVPGAEWTDSRCNIASISGSSITMQQPCFGNVTTWPPTASLPSSVENYPVLDQEGQWYLDRSAHVLRYKLRQQEVLSTATVVAPTTTTLLSANGTATNPVHDIVISGLTFAYDNWAAANGPEGFVDVQADVVKTGSTGAGTAEHAAVAFHSVNNVTFTRNVVTHTAAGGVAFNTASSNNSIIGNVVADVGGNGISVGDAPYNPDAPPATLESGDTIQNNYVHNVGASHLGAVGIVAGFVKNTTISHNDVSRTPYTGISLGWGWGHTTPSNMVNNHVDFNHVHDVMTTALFDGGGIYLNGPQGSSPRSTVANNFVDGDPQPFGSIYLDAKVANVDVQSNVVAHGASNWIYIQSCCGATATNNTATGNYTDTTRISAYDSSNTVSGNSTGLTSWPAGAVSIMNASGIQAAYSDITGGPIDTNVALNKSATGSSTYSSQYTAAMANDGSSASGWSPTGADHGAFWEVDLGAQYTLSQIQVLTRQDNDQSATRANFYVWLSNYAAMGSGYTEICYQGSTPLPNQGFLTCNAPSNQTFRYVAIVKSNSDYFYLSEVRVFGH